MLSALSSMAMRCPPAGSALNGIPGRTSRVTATRRDGATGEAIGGAFDFEPVSDFEPLKSPAGSPHAMTVNQTVARRIHRVRGA